MNRTAWLHRIYTDHRQQIFTHLLWKTRGDWHLSQDLTSETFLRAADNADSYTDNNPAAWLQRIAVNLMLDHYKSAYHRYVMFVNEDYYSELDGDEPERPFYETPDPDSNPEIILINTLDGQIQNQQQAQRLTAVLAAIAALRSELQRRYLELALEGLNTSDACTVLGTHPDALKQLRLRAIRSVRTQLGVAA